MVVVTTHLIAQANILSQHGDKSWTKQIQPKTRGETTYKRFVVCNREWGT